MTNTYRLMIYFAHSTMVIYEKSITSHEFMTVSEFRNANEKVCQRVFDEGLSIMFYELSYEQVDRAIACYLKSKFHPSSVDNTEIYKHTIVN